jgi:hypothetical protein
MLHVCYVFHVVQVVDRAAAACFFIARASCLHDDVRACQSRASQSSQRSAAVMEDEAPGFRGKVHRELECQQRVERSLSG